MCWTYFWKRCLPVRGCGCCHSPVVFDSLQPHGLQHTRPPCPLATPEVFPSSFPLHQWCHAAISSSDAFFSFCPQYFPDQGLFQWVVCLHQMTKILELQLWPQSFQQVFRVDFLKIDGFDLPALQGNSRSLLCHHGWKASILWHSAFFMVQLSHQYVNTGKTIALTIWTFVGRVTPEVGRYYSVAVLPLILSCDPGRSSPT